VRLKTPFARARFRRRIKRSCATILSADLRLKNMSVRFAFTPDFAYNSLFQIRAFCLRFWGYRTVMEGGVLTQKTSIKNG
jgi:hypothetical protein